MNQSTGLILTTNILQGIPPLNSIYRIVEYSTISTLEYFEDTLANMGLLEA